MERGTSNSSIQDVLKDLRACSRLRNLQRGKQVHVEAAEHGLASDIRVRNALVNMYAKCCSMAKASELFESIRYPNVDSWTAVISGYAANGQGSTGLQLFSRMTSAGAAPSPVTLVAALKCCSSLAPEEACREKGQELQRFALANGYHSDSYVQSALIDMYAKGGDMEAAWQVFVSMKHPDVVAYTALILGYAGTGHAATALSLFSRMRAAGLVPDPVAFVAALKTCTSLEKGRDVRSAEQLSKLGKTVHNLAVENGCDSYVPVQNTLIDMYSKRSSMVEACHVFHSMRIPDVVSWNALIYGYVENGQSVNALDLFRRMKTSGLAPDHVTFMVALKACGMVGGLEYGRTVHLDMSRACKDLDVVLVTCLVDFFAKCCSLAEARAVFVMHPRSRNVLTWTALLGGYSSCGDHRSVFRVFEEMQNAGVLLDAAVFGCVLACCAHAGLVEEGKKCFDVMSATYSVDPTVEHYTSMVCILGRANKLDEAMALLQSMPCTPDDITWRTVLDACRKWKNVKIGKLAFQCLTCSNERDSAAYVLMGQTYESSGMLREQVRMTTDWNKRGEETCWTNEVGEVNSFHFS